MIYIFTGWLADEYFVVVVLHFGLCAQEYHVPCTMYRRHYPLCRLEDWQHHPPGKVLQLYPLFLARIQLFDPHYPDQAQLFFFPEKLPFSYPVVEGKMVVSDAWLFEHPKKIWPRFRAKEKLQPRLGSVLQNAMHFLRMRLVSFSKTRNQIILTKQSGRVPKILTASKILQISIALCRIKAKIHSKFGLSR